MRRFGLSLTVLVVLAGCGTEATGGADRDAQGTGELAPAPAPVVEPSPPPSEPVVDPEAQARLEEEARARQALEAERARLEAEREAFETRYPKHGVVYHYLAQVFAEPSADSPVVGYMRRGSQFRATARVEGSGCSGGWHEVPGDGYVCRGEGYKIGDEPQTFEPSPVPPALDDALPYLYAYTQRDDVAQYWELPDLEQEAQAHALFEELRREEEQHAAAADAGVPPAPDAGAAQPGEEETSAQADDVEAPPPPGQEGEPGAEEPAEEDGLTFPGFLRMRMLRGFYVSLDRIEETSQGRRFYRTVRGAYVRASALTPNEPPESRGVVLGGSWELPVAFVWRNGATRYRRVPRTGALRADGRVDRQTAIAVANSDLVWNDRRYVVGRDGVVVRKPAVRLVERREPPPGVPEGAQWIHVKLSEQALVAYEGDRPVFATLVSTGKEGHETPTGLFRIQSKHVSTTMDDTSSADGAYSIEDVPWTMYFNGNYALHGAFWHYTFGRVRSHGCVNLSPADARWLFQWSTPTLPAAWHGIFADPQRNPGTYVFVEE